MKREVYTVEGSEADWLAYDAEGLRELKVRFFTAVLNAGRGKSVGIPLSEDERRIVNEALKVRVEVRR